MLVDHAERFDVTVLADGVDRAAIRAELNAAHDGFHAFACLSGNTLAFDALDRNVAAYLGYRVAVNVEWEPSQLPTEVTMVLRELVTMATVRLALGERSAMAIRRDVRAVAVRMKHAIRSHQDTLELKHLMGLRAFANSLHQDLVLEGTDVQT